MLSIKKIEKISDLGLFNSFIWKSSLPEFKKFNVIYGWNGTGKTTLSKFFDALNRGEDQEYPNLKYIIKDSRDTSYTQGVTFNTNIRVFNKVYIENNVDFKTQSSKAIQVILGEENKEILKRIEEDERRLEKIELEILTKKTERETNVNIRNNTFTDIARTISQGTQGAIVRNYNRKNAEESYKEMHAVAPLNQAELTVLTKSVSQDVMLKQNFLELKDTNNLLIKLCEDADRLLSQTVTAVLLKLKENPEISEWVETGLRLHQKTKSDTCEFCGSSLTSDRLTELVSHFNEADAKLKSDIDDLVNKLRSIYSQIQRIQPVDKMNFYQEYRDEYNQKAVELLKEREKVLSEIESLADQILAKKTKTTEPIRLINTPNLDKFETHLIDLNKTILSHNIKTADFDNKRNKDSKKIELHYLSTIYEKIHELDDKIETITKEIIQLENGVAESETILGKSMLKSRIIENKAKISSTHRGCEILNLSLKKFLGHGEITFSVNGDNSGYQISRGDRPAKCLSEGEQTAIAFVYFVTQLNDQSFKPEDGIVVVDDPISSLDANSQFQAFSFLKTSTENVGQLFLLTHNFDFLKLVLSWVKSSRSPYSLYMIKNTYSLVDGSRTAYIDTLDTALEKFESEYHYLFNVLSTFRDDGTIENAYKVPNIARKLLDNFLMFCIPTNENTYSRLKMLDFDEQKKVALYKFVNDQSHITGSGFDPSLVPETQKCIGYLFELMESTFQSHYNYLKSSTS